MPTLPLYLLAFFSGFAALIYQVAWSRMLSLTFGSTTLAVSAVVAGFMGGMGIGAWLYHRVGDRVSVPLRGYGYLELGIAATTLLFTQLFAPLPQLFAAAADVIPHGTALEFFRVATAILVLALPSALMGATFPALCQSLIHSAEEVDTRLGWIYGINTLGAAAGALAAGFLMIEFLGSRGSVFFANGVNALVGLAALYLARRSEETASDSAAASQQDALASSLPYWLTGAVLFGSGFATLGYEIIWFRALHYLMGSGTYVLSTALVIFLLGLGLGGLLYRAVLKFAPAEWALGFGQLAIALLAIGAIGAEQKILVDPDLLERFSLYSGRVSTLSWQWRIATGAAVAVAIMLPATVFMGLAFPLASRLFLGSVGHLSARVGLAYLLSNLGSICGAVAAAMWILPSFGAVRGTTLLACINLLLGISILLRAPSVRLRAAAVVAAALPILLALALPPRLSFIYSEVGRTDKPVVLLFEGESDLGTVQVLAKRRKPNARAMTIDGVPIAVTQNWDAELHAKQTLLAHLPMSLDRDIRHTLNLGVASASTIRTLARYPWVESLDAVEINPAVIDALEFFRERDVLDDPRSELFVEDAVHYLLRSPRQYDLIISDAKQHVFFGGNAKILSSEFYEYSLARLSECGIFVQFLSLINPQSYITLTLRTLLEVFPEVEIFVDPPSHVMTMGSRCPIGTRARPSLAELEQAGAVSEVKAAFLPDPTQLPALWVASGDEIAAVLGPGPVNSWDRLPLQFSSFRINRLGPDLLVGTLGLLMQTREAEPEGKAEFSSSPFYSPALALNRAFVLWAGGHPAEAQRLVDEVLDRYPDHALALRARKFVSKRMAGESS